MPSRVAHRGKIGTTTHDSRHTTCTPFYRPNRTPPFLDTGPAICYTLPRMTLSGAGWSTVDTASTSGGATSGSQPDSDRPEPVDNEPLRASLRTSHRELLRRMFLGEPLNEVAVALGMPYATVKYIVKSPLFQAALAEMQQEADGKVIDTAQRMRMERELTNAAEAGIPVAFKAMNESQSPATRAKIAFGFLDRAGMSPSRKVEEKREGFREMLERLDEMERHMAPGSEVELKFSVRKDGGGSANERDSGIPRDVTPSANAESNGHARAVEFLSKSLEQTP